MPANKRILVWPDWHLPYHHKKATAEAVYFAKQYKPNVFVDLGDMFDCNSVSSHDPNPSKHLRFVEERDEGLAELDKLLAVLPRNCDRHITMGNHEDMLRRYVWRRAAALDGLVSFDDPFGLTARKFTITPHRHMLKVGKVHFSHDIGGAGQGAAINALRRVQGNVVQGHNHRAVLVYETNARGKSHFGCSAGWLGDPNHVSDYMDVHSAKTQWNHAVVTIEMDKHGMALAQIHPIFGVPVSSVWTVAS